MTHGRVDNKSEYVGIAKLDTDATACKVGNGATPGKLKGLLTVHLVISLS